MITKVAVFKNINDTSEPKYVSVEYVLDAIKTGKFKTDIEAIRDASDKATQNRLKSNLSSVLFSSSKQEGIETTKGRISYRTDKGMLEHSGFICIDLDAFESDEAMFSTKYALMSDEYVYSVFQSPTGAGLKVLFKIPNEINNHREYFYGLKKYLNSPYFDDSCVNEARVCYVSYDDETYINKDSKLFTNKQKQKKSEVVHKNVESNIVTDHNKIIEVLYKWWTEKYGLVEGERNRNCYILAMALNEFGVSELNTRSFMTQFSQDGFDTQEINLIIESAYSKTHLFDTKTLNNELSVDDYKPKEVIDKSDVSVNFHNIYKSAFVDVSKKIEYPPVAVSMGTHTMGSKTFPIPFGTYGNFSCIVGPSKSKKTFLKSLITASYIGGNTSNYASSIKSHRDRECFVLDIDTEQSSFHAQNVFRRVMRLVGVDNYEFYKPFALRPFEASERLQFIEYLIYESDMKDNIGFISIDGLADLVDDFNDLKKSQAVIQKVMKWTSDKQFHLNTILHSNYGSSKAVGHIGSSMLKKAETVCSVLPEGDAVKASFTHTRGFPIDEIFYAVDKMGLPYILGDSVNKNEVDIVKKVIKNSESESFEVDKSLPIISVKDAFDDIPF